MWVCGCRSTGPGRSLYKADHCATFCSQLSWCLLLGTSHEGAGNGTMSHILLASPRARASFSKGSCGMNELLVSAVSQSVAQCHPHGIHRSLGTVPGTSSLTRLLRHLSSPDPSSVGEGKNPKLRKEPTVGRFCCLHTLGSPWSSSFTMATFSP